MTDEILITSPNFKYFSSVLLFELKAVLKFKFGFKISALL